MSATLKPWRAGSSRTKRSSSLESSAGSAAEEPGQASAQYADRLRTDDPEGRHANGGPGRERADDVVSDHCGWAQCPGAAGDFRPAGWRYGRRHRRCPRHSALLHRAFGPRLPAYGDWRPKARRSWCAPVRAGATVQVFGPRRRFPLFAGLPATKIKPVPNRLPARAKRRRSFGRACRKATKRATNGRSAAGVPDRDQRGPRRA